MFATLCLSLFQLCVNVHAGVAHILLSFDDPPCRVHPPTHAVDHVACTDLRSHHGEKRGGGLISNACPKCSWFSPQITDWPLWDGKVWSDHAEEPDVQAASASAETSSLGAEGSHDEVMPPLKRRRRDKGSRDMDAD